MSLTPIDFKSETGKRLIETLNTHIAAHQKALEADALDAIKTAKVRGRLAECRALLALATVPAQEPSP